jgi:putative spermidine/putrescine transport system permease protein
MTRRSRWLYKWVRRLEKTWPGARPLTHYTGLIVLGLALALPFVAFALNAFSRQWFYPQLVPDTWSLSAWKRIFSARSRVPLALFNSAVTAVGVTALSIVIGLPASRALGTHRFRGKRILEFLIFLPTMVPPITVGMGLSVTFLRLGLGGSLLGVGLAHLVPVMPYVVLTLAGVFANYSPAHEEQARTLGAGPLAILWYITLPAIFPGLVVAGLFAFLISWSQYVLTLLVGRGQIIALPVLLFSSIPGGDSANIAAQSLLFIGPAILILLLTSRYLSGKQAAVQGFGRL